MGNKIHSDGRRTIYENIGVYAALKDTTDLEAATKTITATAEASGLGSATYSVASTLAISPIINGVAATLAACRMAILRMGTRLSVTIDSDDGTHDLRCRVYVDAQDANHLLYDLTYSTTGNQLSVQDCSSATKATIFPLLQDSAAHTFYFYFWSPGNHSPVISLCQLWWGIGGTSTATSKHIQLQMVGNASFGITHTSPVTGAHAFTIRAPYNVASSTSAISSGSTTSATINSYDKNLNLTGDIYMAVGPALATDLLVLVYMVIVLQYEV